MNIEPIAETILAFLQAIMENPIASSFIFGIVRTASGYLQNRWKSATGQDFDKKQLGVTLLKYEVAANALFTLVPSEYTAAVAPLVMIADIIWSAAKKMKNGE